MSRIFHTSNFFLAFILQFYDDSSSVCSVSGAVGTQVRVRWVPKQKRDQVVRFAVVSLACLTPPSPPQRHSGRRPWSHFIIYHFSISSHSFLGMFTLCCFFFVYCFLLLQLFIYNLFYLHNFVFYSDIFDINKCEMKEKMERGFGWTASVTWALVIGLTFSSSGSGVRGLLTVSSTSDALETCLVDGWCTIFCFTLLSPL